MNPELITAFAAGVATAAAAGGVTAAVTLRNVLYRSGAWKDSVSREERGADPLTGLYNREGFVSAVEDFDVTAAETNDREYLLCVLAYNGLDKVEATHGALVAEHAIADIGADLVNFALDDLACRFEHSCFAAVVPACDVDLLDEHLQVAVCSSAERFNEALWTGTAYAFSVFGEVAGLADEIYGPSLRCDLSVTKIRLAAGVDVGQLLEVLMLEATGRFSESDLRTTAGSPRLGETA